MVLAFVLGHGNELAEPEVVDKMAVLLRQMQSSLPQQVCTSWVDASAP